MGQISHRGTRNPKTGAGNAAASRPLSGSRPAGARLTRGRARSGAAILFVCLAGADGDGRLRAPRCRLALCRLRGSRSARFRRRRGRVPGVAAGGGGGGSVGISCSGICRRRALRVGCLVLLLQQSVEVVARALRHDHGGDVGAGGLGIALLGEAVVLVRVIFDVQSVDR